MHGYRSDAMIGWLCGTVIDKHPGKLLLNVNGVGYSVTTSLTTFFKIETELLNAPDSAIGLYIHTLVREDAFLLYGFFEQSEKRLFLTLTKISGIGPKIALGILSNITVAELG